MGAETPLALSLSGLAVTRAGAPGTAGFRLDVDRFDLAPGTRVAILGESGSGKTTFLEALGLLAWPEDLGTYLISPEADGRMMDLTETLMRRRTDVASRIRARLMGFVPQDGGLLPWLTVRENAALAVTLADGDGGAARVRARIAGLARDMGIGGCLDRLPGALSGGQRQRAAVLRATATGARVILADEPTAALDGATARLVMGALTEAAAATGAAIVAVSHDRGLMDEFGFAPAEIALSLTDEGRQARLSHADRVPA